MNEMVTLESYEMQEIEGGVAPLAIAFFGGAIVGAGWAILDYALDNWF